MGRSIHFGVLVPQGWKGEFAEMDGPTGWRAMLDVGVEAERLGLDSIWLYDHFQAIPSPARPIPVFECWTSLMALAAATTRVGLGQMVTCSAYRNPAYLAKVAATLDVASGGRLQMGIGAGWHEEEFISYGYGFPTVRERMDLLEDTAQILTRMWRDTPATYEGKVASITNAFCEPKPLQLPRPPMWIGGGGEKRTLKIVAAHADYANTGGSVEVFTRKRDVLRQHCEAIGRDPAEITLTHHADLLIGQDDADVRALLTRYPSLWGTPEADRLVAHHIGTPQRVIDRLGEYIDAGAGGFVVWMPDYPHTDSLQAFAEQVLPAFR